MSIRDWGLKIKGGWENTKTRLPQGENATRYYTATIIILVGLSSFGLGRLSAIDEKREPVIIENTSQSASVLSSSPPLGGGDTRGGVPNKPLLNPRPTGTIESFGQAPLVKGEEEIAAGGKLMGSRNGTKYYFPWCGSNIAEKNKIWFNSEAEAKAKGYSPAANCKGLK